MTQRQVLVPTLDVGHQSFESFLGERLDDLKTDLLRECDRIANSRELTLKKELNDLHSQNEELHAKLQIVTKRAPDPVLEPLKEDNETTDQNVALQVYTEVDIDENSMVGEAKLASSGDASCLQECREEANLTSSVEKSAKPDYYVIWEDWAGTHEVAHVHHTLSEGDHKDSEDYGDDDEREEEFAWTEDQIRDTEKLDHSPCTVNPNSTRALVWELLGIPVLFYDIVTIPMQVFFKPEGPAFAVIGWILVLYWTCDLFLRLLVIGIITKDGIIEQDRMTIMKAYLRSSFAFDFFMVAPDWFSKIAGAGGGMRNVAILRLFRLLRLMRLMRMSKMKKIMRNIEDTIDSEYFSVGVSIGFNLCTILATCHYMGCCWFWVGNVKFDGQASWLDSNEHVRDAAWPDQYLVCLHWAIAQFTPGASRIQPANAAETFAAIIVLIFGLVFLSCFISALAHARQRLQALTSKMDRDNWVLRRYLRQQNVSLRLRLRTLKYVENCLEPMMMRVQRKDVSLLPLLSRPLQLEVQEEQYFHTLRGHPFFNRLRERSGSLTLHLFVNVVIEILMADLDLLFDAGSIAHEMFFVSRGGLAYLLHGTNEVTHLNTYSWCAEHVLWTQWVHNGTAKATVETDILGIDSAKFRSTVLEHRQRFYIIKCALAYVKDLNSCLDNGMVVNDTTLVSSGSASCYEQTIRSTRTDNAIRVPCEAAGSTTASN